MTLPTSAVPDKLEAYRRARGAAVDWLLGHMNADGSIGDPREGYFFYRAPWTFASAGQTATATAVCGWIRRNMLTPRGQIAGPYRLVNDAYAYRDATLLVGAHMAMQYDLSYGLLPGLLAWQDPNSGGSPNDRQVDGAPSDNMDIPYSCGTGFAFLQVGLLDRARHVYRFLHALYAAQRELPHRFYYAWSRTHQRPIEAFPAEQQFWYVVDNAADRRQRWTVGGIAAGFLCRLYLADPQPEYLALAREYQSFSMGATQHQFKYAQVCKSGWGSSLLYQITGEDEYLDWTCRMGDWFVDRQLPDGHWYWDAYTTRGAQIELTLEFAMHLDTLSGSLASRLSAAAAGL
ncbi:MAG: hypothetical protein M3069_03290 [Chloroflexota bacterium]|nr:hypothetical protein [Chloroflexota bacterium]